MSKPDSKLTITPMDEIPGNPNDRKGGEGKYNGEPGWPQRTTGGTQLPEKTLDSCGNFGKAPTEG